MLQLLFRTTQLQLKVRNSNLSHISAHIDAVALATLYVRVNKFRGFALSEQVNYNYKSNASLQISKLLFKICYYRFSVKPLAVKPIFEIQMFKLL